MNLTPELKWYSNCKTQLKRMIRERREGQILVWIYKWETRFEVAIFFSYESCIAFSTIVTLKVPWHVMTNDSVNDDFWRQISTPVSRPTWACSSVLDK